VNQQAKEVVEEVLACAAGLVSLRHEGSSRESPSQTRSTRERDSLIHNWRAAGVGVGRSRGKIRADVAYDRLWPTGLAHRPALGPRGGRARGCPPSRTPAVYRHRLVRAMAPALARDGTVTHARSASD